MYLEGQGTQRYGPGTGLIQRISWTTGQEAQMQGLGDCGCGCDRCGGLGLFDSGWDVSTWGLPEWGVVTVAAYMVGSTLFTTKRAARSLAAIPGRRRAKKAEYHRTMAKRLSSKSRGGLF